MSNIDDYMKLSKLFLCLLSGTVLKRSLLDALITDGLKVVSIDMPNVDMDRIRQLDVVLRNEYETLFDADLSGVRIHTGHYADELAKNANAFAVTIGQDIYFADGQFAHDTEAGKSLLAHELTHTVQDQMDQRMVYLEDIQEAEYDGSKMEALVSGVGLHAVRQGVPTSENELTIGELAGGSAVGGSAAWNATNSSAAHASLGDFSASGGGQVVEVMARDGQSYRLSPSEYQGLIEGIRRGAETMLREARMNRTDEEYEAYALRWLGYWRGGR